MASDQEYEFIISRSHGHGAQDRCVRLTYPEGMFQMIEDDRIDSEIEVRKARKRISSARYRAADGFWVFRP